jgi:hypothetical protein
MSPKCRAIGQPFCGLGDLTKQKDLVSAQAIRYTHKVDKRGCLMDKIHRIEWDGLVVDIYADETSVRYVFVGDIAESLSLKKLPVVPRQTTIFELSGIRSINSCGIRNWVILMREFSDRTDLRLEKCAVCLVDQFNLVPQTLGSATVSSFYAPYYCSTCDEEIVVLLDTESNWETLGQGIAPEVTHHCGTHLEFDALEDSYFQQINRFTLRGSGRRAG